MAVSNKIPLETRIERVRSGYASDPAYVTQAIRSLADMPLSEYLHDFPLEADRLKRMLKKYGEWRGGMDCKEAAWHIRQIRGCPEAAYAVSALAAPLIKSQREKERRQADVEK